MNLKPEGIVQSFIPYASTFLFELHRDDSEECTYSVDTQCFKVHVLMNGKLIKLPGCKEAICTFDEYNKYILTITFDDE